MRKLVWRDIFTLRTYILLVVIFHSKCDNVQLPLPCAEKVYTEISAVIGSSRDPSITDRDNMPYTNAVIHEMQRMANIIPLNVVRMSTSDTTIGNYTIPKVNRAAKRLAMHDIFKACDDKNLLPGCLWRSWYGNSGSWIMATFTSLLTRWGTQSQFHLTDAHQGSSENMKVKSVQHTMWFGGSNEIHCL